MSELKIKSIPASGQPVLIYDGEFDLTKIGSVLLNPTDLADTQAVLRGAKIVYSYNKETSSTKIASLGQTLKAFQMLLGFTTIEGVIDNTLEKAGITRTSDLRTKIKECMPDAGEFEIDAVLAKVNKTLELMGEVNEKFKQYAPASLPKGEQYFFRHHFPSPKSLQKKETTTEQTTN